MKLTNVVVTGASCMVGRALIDELLRRGHNVTGAIHSVKGSLNISHPRYREIILPMKDYAAATSLFENQDVLFHFAWNGTRGETREDKALQDSNYKTSMELINVVIACREGPHKIFLAGSQAEYGEMKQQEPVDETNECHPLTEYGKAKYRLYEDALSMIDRKAILIEPRLFSIYGKNDRVDTLLSYALTRMSRNLPCTFGDCTQLWNFCHTTDVVRALYALMASNIQSGAYNVASDDTRPLREFLIEAKNVLKSNSSLEFGQRKIDPHAVMELNPSINKIKSATGWTPRIEFAKGIVEASLI